MADGDYYVSYDEVRHLLMNQSLGVSGARLYDDTALETALRISMGKMHQKLDYRTTKVTTEPFVSVLMGIQKDLIGMMILQARHYQDNNLADAGSVMAFWQTAPTLTFAHLTELREIKAQLRGNTVAKNYNSSTGLETNSSNSYYYGGYP